VHLRAARRDVSPRLFLTNVQSLHRKREWLDVYLVITTRA
jgi:hypothetical protein